MKGYLLKHGKHYIKSEINGTDLTYTFCNDSTFHIVITLKDLDLYNDLKQEINDIYDSIDDKDEALCEIYDFLDSNECYRTYFSGETYCYKDMRNRQEIENYESEACDKSWLARNWYPGIHAPNRTVERILNVYDDIPEDGYDTYDCGYWNGIMAALRWVLGEEKNFLDT